MLDFPELFAPARIVKGAISIDCSSPIDLKPETVIREIEGGASGSGGVPFDRLAMKSRSETYSAVAVFVGSAVRTVRATGARPKMVRKADPTGTSLGTAQACRIAF